MQNHQHLRSVQKVKGAGVERREHFIITHLTIIQDITPTYVHITVGVQTSSITIDGEPFQTIYRYRSTQ